MAIIPVSCLEMKRTTRDGRYDGDGDDDDDGDNDNGAWRNTGRVRKLMS